MRCPTCEPFPRDVALACPDCGGAGFAHCCEGLCEQPQELDERPAVLPTPGFERRAAASGA